MNEQKIIEVTVNQPEPNYWWALILVIIPILLGYILKPRGKDKK